MSRVYCVSSSHGLPSQELSGVITRGELLEFACILIKSELSQDTSIRTSDPTQGTTLLAMGQLVMSMVTFGSRAE